MRDIPIPEHPTVKDTFVYLKALHECIENHQEENAGKIKRTQRLTLSTAFAIGAVGLTLIGAVISGGIWVGRTDSSLSQIPIILQEQAKNSSNIDKLVSTVSDIKDMTEQNNEALLGNSSRAEQQYKSLYKQGQRNKKRGN